MSMEKVDYLPLLDNRMDFLMKEVEDHAIDKETIRFEVRKELLYCIFPCLK